MRLSRVLSALLAGTALLAAGLAFVLAPGLGAPPDRQRDTDPMLEAREEAEELQEPGEAILGRQLFGSAQADPAAAFPQARAQALALGAETARSAPAVAKADWEMVGPTNIGGRVLDVAVDPEVRDRIFVAAASGGVWRSDDAGDTFEPAWPTDETQAIGALTITPSGTLFAGTGETGPGGGSLTYGGTGLYRSRDSGRTWQRIGLERSSRISRIVVDPSDEDRIFVAASGPLFQPGGERGLYRSEDGGDSWERVLEGDNATTGATDVAIDPTTPRKMFAAMWDHQREPDVRRYNGVGSGLYRSVDGGSSWQRVPGPQFGPDRALGRIGVAIAPTDPNTIFVMASGESGAYRGMFKSSDGGATWAPIAHPLVVADPVVYGWWFGRVWVDPKDANHVFVAGLYLIESKDGGLTWDTVDGVHADQHAMAWDPKQADRVYLGNDGGVYRSDENGANFQFGSYQPFSQLYGLDVSEQDPARRTAGLQDNGAVRSYPEEYNEFNGGDGQRTLINPENQDVVYACSQYGDCNKYRDGGDSGEDMGTKVVSTRKNWHTPIELDPENPDVLYTGGEILSRSTDGGESFQTISGDLSNGPGRETNPLFRNFGTLTTISAGPQRTGVIYAGTDDGNVWFTGDGGTTWAKSTDPDLPRAWVTRLQADPRDPRTAYVTFSGFRQGADGAYLLKTTDGGRNWEDVTGDLPKAPLNDVNVIGGDLLVASDVGVYLSRDGGRDWLRVGRNLPLVPVFELRHHPGTDTLYAATFGRSMWRIPLAALKRR